LSSIVRPRPLTSPSRGPEAKGVDRRLLVELGFREENILVDESIVET
jgi:hypothetical protein